MCIPVIELIFLMDGQMPVQQYEQRVYKKNKATKKKIIINKEKSAIIFKVHNFKST